ncbi:MAG: hypothetical protein IJ072_03760, partial [Oscillospiraceae bacterium]|nr:hypothetical protein [Oscillospiraceae bacterium]
MATFSNQASLSYSGGVTSSNIVMGELMEVLSVSKASVGENYEAGSIVTYAVSLVNSGGTDLTGLTVTDDMGAYELDGQVLTPLEYVEGTVRYFSDGVLQPEPTVTAGTE